MSIQLLGFAWVFLPTLLICAVIRGNWLPALVVVSAVFQATAVFTLSAGDQHLAVTPYVVTAALICGVVALRWRELLATRLLYAKPAPSPWALRLLFGFGIFALLATVSGPLLFAGIIVNPPLDPVAGPGQGVPLHHSINNIAQVINLLLHFGVLVYLGLEWIDNPLRLQRRLAQGFVCALVCVVAIGFYERLALMGWWPSLIAFWKSNPLYAQDLVGVSHFATWLGPTRISAPFSEPRFASAFLASLFIGYLAVVLLLHRLSVRLRWFYALAACLAGAALVNTWGTTGLLAAGLCGSTILVLAVMRLFRYRQQFPYGVVLTAALGILVIAATLMLTGFGQWLMALGWIHAGRLTQPNDYDMTLLGWGLTVVRETWGLGAGLGSHRTSSFVLTLMAETGIIATILFLAALLRLAYQMSVCQGGRLDLQVFAVAGLGTALLAAIATNGFSQSPFVWVFIFAALVFLADGERSESSGERGSTALRLRAAKAKGR